MYKKIGKLMFSLLCLVTIVTMQSCSKEKDNDDLIVGKWKIIESSNDGVNWRESIMSGLVYDFSSNGTVSCMGFSTKYSIKGNTMILDGDNYEIIKLTKSELIWKTETYTKLKKL